VRLVVAHPQRHGTWKMTVKSVCPGGDTRTRTLAVRV
jgi:hypothetical protein